MAKSGGECPRRHCHDPRALFSLMPSLCTPSCALPPVNCGQQPSVHDVHVIGCLSGRSRDARLGKCRVAKRGVVGGVGMRVLLPSCRTCVARRDTFSPPCGQLRNLLQVAVVREHENQDVRVVACMHVISPSRAGVCLAAESASTRMVPFWQSCAVLPCLVRACGNLKTMMVLVHLFGTADATARPTRDFFTTEGSIANSMQASHELAPRACLIGNHVSAVLALFFFWGVGRNLRPRAPLQRRHPSRLPSTGAK